MSMPSPAPLATHRRRLLAFTAMLLLALAGLASAEVVRKDNLQISVAGQLSPHRLPRSGSAPVAVSVSGQISTLDGTNPPQLDLLKIEINRHGRLEFQGLPTCKIGQIQPASNGRALRACRSALVGSGKYFGTITLPGSAPYSIEGKLLVFNGSEGNRHVLLGHIYSAHPFATSFVITFGISTHAHGEYGTTLTANLTKALGNKRNLTGIEMTLSRRYSYGGRRRSYVSAACPAPKGFSSVNFPLARTTFAFKGGESLTSVLNRTCGVRG